jgi:hypothetical protein
MHGLMCLPAACYSQADKDLYASLFNAVGAAVTSAPDCVPVPLLACLAEAQLLVADKLGAQAPKLPEQVSRDGGCGGGGVFGQLPARDEFLKGGCGDLCVSWLFCGFQLVSGKLQRQ